MFYLLLLFNCYTIRYHTRVTRLVPNLELIQRNVESTLDQRLAVSVRNQHCTTLRDGNDSGDDWAESAVIEFDSHSFSLSCC